MVSLVSLGSGVNIPKRKCIPLKIVLLMLVLFFLPVVHVNDHLLRFVVCVVIVLVLLVVILKDIWLSIRRASEQSSTIRTVVVHPPENSSIDSA